MQTRRFSTRELALAALLAATYATLTMVLYAPSYGPIQLRFSEALTVLPFLFSAATPGLFVGCLIANLLSPYGPIDVIFGSLATLLAAYLTQRCNNKWLAPLPPVLCNAVIIGATIAYAQTGFTGAFAAAFAYNFVTVGAGQLVACYGFGTLVLMALPKVPFFQALIAPEKLDTLGNWAQVKAV